MHFIQILFLLTLSPLICVSCEHFVLVHGAYHGAWCWYKVATMLKSAGHNVTTVELAASGINPIQVQEIRQISQYYEPLMTFMESLPPNEKVILVGHSIGGVSASVAMEKFPHKISVAVFVTAYVLSQNLTYPTILQEDLTLALSLVRPDPLYNDVELLKKETAVTNDRNGRVPKIFVISKSDNLITEDFQKWIIERSGPFAEVKVINDSDHMVVFSKPQNLTSILIKIAHKYGIRAYHVPNNYVYRLGYISIINYDREFH
ncbi:hypothetical protein RYX36_023247 [Vicia faba]